MSGRKIIFAVDDEKAMHHIFKTILEDQFELVCFDSPRDMLSTVDNVRPDLTIIDLGLGVMDGYECCATFKAKHGMAEIPVVFVTGRDFDEDEGRAFFSGGDEYVRKPIAADSFLTLVNSLIP